MTNLLRMSHSERRLWTKEINSSTEQTMKTVPIKSQSPHSKHCQLRHKTINIEQKLLPM